jgi:hypothetical protein
MNGSRRIIGLVLLSGLALGLRLAVVSALFTDPALPSAGHTSAPPNGPVAYEHGQIAENLLAGRGFSIEFLGAEGPTSQQAPFYPLLLAGVWWCLGIGTPQAILAAQLLQCLAGTGLVLVVAWLGWSLLPEQPSVGWVAAIGAALYPTHLYMVTHLQVALWAALVLTLLLAVCVSPRWRATRGGAILAGCLAGVLLLIEPILALALPICAAAFWLGEVEGGMRGRFGRRGTRAAGYPLAGRVARLALMAAIATTIVTPWTVRNWIVHGQLVPIKSTFGYAFWQGNNPVSWGTDKIPKTSAEALRLTHDGSLAGMDRALWAARHETLYIDDVLLKPTGYREFAGLSEPERSRLLGQRAWRFVRANPAQYARLCLRRLQYFLLFDETNPKAANRLYRISTVVWLVLALIGLSISRSRWRALWPTYAIFSVVVLFHSLVIVSARFRIPVEPMTFVWAATAVAPLAVRLLRRPQIKVYRPGEHPRDPFGPGHVLKGPHYDVPIRRRAG